MPCVGLWGRIAIRGWLRYDVVSVGVSIMLDFHSGDRHPFRTHKRLDFFAMNNNSDFPVDSSVKIKDDYPLAEYRGKVGIVVKTISFNKAFLRFDVDPAKWGTPKCDLLIDCSYLIKQID